MFRIHNICLFIKNGIGFISRAAQRDRERERESDREMMMIIIIMYIYHALINALSAHTIHSNLNMIFYTHVKHSPTKTIYIKYYLKKK